MQSTECSRRFLGLRPWSASPIEHRLSHILSGTPAAIAINIFGEDLSELRRVAKAIEGELSQIDGARDVNANREVMITTLPIRYRHAELAAVGLSPADAAEQVREAMYGEVVDSVNQGVRQYDLVVRLAPEETRVRRTGPRSTSSRSRWSHGPPQRRGRHRARAFKQSHHTRERPA